MKYILTILVGLFIFNINYAQNFTGEEAEVEKVILTLFDGMREADSAKVHSVFLDDADMHTVFTDNEGKNNLRKGSLERFLTAVGTPHDVVWDEPVWDMKIDIDGALASVWTKYAFYAGKQFSHCGVDAFQLFKTSEGWKIIQITDTRQKEGCEVPSEIEAAHK